jgi:hypothetical protein
MAALEPAAGEPVEIGAPLGCADGVEATIEGALLGGTLAVEPLQAAAITAMTAMATA